MMGDILKMDFMSKRSQMKRKLSCESYKNRWFTLSRQTLCYFSGKIDTGVGKVKDTIELKSIVVVEKVDEEALGNKRNAFQVRYTDQKTSLVYTLYIIADHDRQREEWVQAIRNGATDEGALFWRIYHPGAWQHKARRYTCCGSINLRSRGCEPTFCAFFEGEEINESHSVKKSDSSLSLKENIHVFALYSFKASTKSELSFNKGEELELISNNLEEDWIKVKNNEGKLGVIPSVYVQALDSDSLEAYEWFFKNTSSLQAERLLARHEEEGCFLVRDSSKTQRFTLSLYYRRSDVCGEIKHYPIKKHNDQFFLSENHKFLSIPQLIYYHKHNCAGLITRLKISPRNKVKPHVLLELTVQIEPRELQLMESLGSGQFGSVRRGMYRRGTEVAVKTVHQGSMTPSQFLAEAELMARLQHPNLVHLYGVSVLSEPIMILSEYVKNGPIDKYLKRNKSVYCKQPLKLLDMCLQVGMAMTYLEENNIIHRDLAGRNCLVGEEDVIKVCDFGLARFVLDDEYTCSEGSKFAAKWASVEVLEQQLFSSKSDVWAFGVLMWEVFTCGSSPYQQVANTNIHQHVVLNKLRLQRPNECSESVYAVMQSSWAEIPGERPDFSEITENLRRIIEAD